MHPFFLQSIFNQYCIWIPVSSTDKRKNRSLQFTDGRDEHDEGFYQIIGEMCRNRSAEAKQL